MKNLHGLFRADIILPLLLSSTLLFLAQCSAKEKINEASKLSFYAATAVIKPKAETEHATVFASSSVIMDKPEVPILCYHQLRDFKPTDSKTARDYIIPIISFQQQIKFLADSGYHSILPDQLRDYLAYGKPLPEKPVMITFDDTRIEHYAVALPELNKYRFKGVFFIMTVSLNRPGYMSKEQVKQLADEGHSIGLHTWNHKNVKTYSEEDWPVQIEKPAEQLRSITGKPVDYFAYPFGLWDKPALEKIKEHGFKAAFQLSARREEDLPLYSIRRIIVPGDWSAITMSRYMKNSF